MTGTITSQNTDLPPGTPVYIENTTKIPLANTQKLSMFYQKP